MLDNISIGKYIYKDSYIHKIHPFIKLLSNLILIISILFLNYIGNFINLLLMLFIAYFSKVDKKNYLKSILLIRYFVISILIIELLVKIDMLIILNDLLKIMILVLYTSIIMFTTKIDELINGFSCMLKPFELFKINTDKLCIILVLSIKFIYILLDELNDISKAYKSRNLDNCEKIIDKIKNMKLFIGTLIYDAFEKANVISDIYETKLVSINKLFKKNNIKINFIDILFIVSFIIIEGVILCVI